MLSYFVERCIDVQSSAESAITFLANFANWPSWSPWLVQEPDCPISYSGQQGEVGCGYQWDGSMVGAGGMELLEKSEDKLVMQLSFLKPFKSQAKVTFNVNPATTGCKICWTMQSKVPWFLFFMKGMFENWIGMDYQRGLIMLKSQLETGEVHSKVSILGRQSWPDTHYIAFSSTASTTELGPIMQDHFNRLNQYMAQESIAPSGVPFAIYNSVNMKTTISEFLSCIPVSSHQLSNIPDDMILGHLPASPSYVIRHEGEYPYMGNAWATAMTASRFHKIKIKRKPMGIERYESDPTTTEPKSLTADVVLLCRR